MNPEKALVAAKELQLGQTGEAPALFHGFSMWPFLREGDAVVISPVRFEDVVLGDIITFRRADKFPTYRVVGMRHASLFLQGDNWPDAILEIERADILGRAVARQRFGKWLTNRSWRWRLLSRLRISFVARRYHHSVTRVVRALWGYEAARREPA